MKEWRLPGLETAHQRPNDRCFQCVEVCTCSEIYQEKDKDSKMMILDVLGGLDI